MIAAYSSNFPGNAPNLPVRVITNGNGSRSVQIKLALGWTTVSDTHPGHGGSMHEFHPDVVADFLVEVRGRLKRFVTPHAKWTE